MAALIGALRVALGIETAQFTDGLKQAQTRLSGLQTHFAGVGAKMKDIGAAMSIGVTAPIVAAGAGVIKLAGDFEASMNRVGISTQAGAGQMKAMSALALKLGKDTTFSASEASGAMDMLAKNGLSATDILNGAAKAALNLASATGAELDPAAAAITDTLQQFKLKTSDLPDIVNQITGAVNQSKLDFVDFQGAAAQAGGVAANVGVKFKDFTAVLAGISPLFASGSDAGTSFKTFLSSLGNPTSKAAKEIDRLGLSFYDAAGQLRPMGEIAEQLRQKIGGLSDQAKTQSLATIFGSDGIRTALGLMALGSKGLDDLKAKIAATDAAAQSSERLKGFNGQLEQLKGSLETLAIAIGQSGVLEAMTGLVASAADIVGRLSELDPAVLRTGTVIAGIAAVMGPTIIALGAVASGVSTLLPIVGSLATFFSGTLVPIIATVGRGLIGLAIAGGPLTLIAAAATAAYLVWKNWDTIGPIVGRMVTAVKTWLIDKLQPVFDTVKRGITAVHDAFDWLTDKVVRHSYVPEMVAGIAAEFATLDQVMVRPALAAVETVRGAMASLPGSLPALSVGSAPGTPTEPAPATTAPIRDAQGRFISPSDVDQGREAFRTMFHDGFRAALDGNLGGFLENWWKDRVASAMSKVLDQLADSVAALFSQSSGSGGGLISAIGQLIGASSGDSWISDAGLASLPGMATGGSFKIPSGGGANRNLLAFAK